MKYKKRIITFMISVFILASCGKQERTISEEEYNALADRNAELENELNKLKNDGNPDDAVPTICSDDNYDQYYAVLDEDDDYHTISIDEGDTMEQQIRVVSQYELKGYYFYIIENASDIPLKVQLHTSAYDQSGNLIKTIHAKVTSLGEKDTPVLMINLSDVENLDHFEYSWESEKAYNSPFMENIQLNETINDDSVIVSAKNNGIFTVGLVKAFAFFFDEDDELLAVSYKPFMNNSYQNDIDPGDEISVRLECPYDFDHVEYYLNGGIIDDYSNPNLNRSGFGASGLIIK